MAVTYRIAVIGDWESVMGFRALGLDTYPVTSPEEAREKIRELAKTDCAVIYLTETLYPLCTDAIDAFKGEPYPAIIPIPDVHGSQGTGIRNLKGYVETAVGVDILFNT